MAELAVVAMVATAAGAGIQAFSQYQQGQASQAEANYKATVAQQRAQYEEQAGGTRAQFSDLQYGQRIGNITAAQGARGLRVDSGTNVDVVASQREAADFDRGQIVANARERARVLRAGGVLEEFAGRNAAQAGEISAFGTGISGVGRVASMGVQQSQLSAGTPVAPRWFQLYNEG